MYDVNFQFGPLLTDEIKKTLQTRALPCLLGEPGIGKTSFVLALANEMHTKAFTIPCNQLVDRADLTGQRLIPIDPKTLKGKNSTDLFNSGLQYQTNFYPRQEITDAIMYAIDNPRETPILFLDEFNRVPADVMSSLLNLATQRVIGTFALPDNLKIMLSGNDKGHVTTVDDAVINRLFWIHVKPDLDTFLEVVPDLNIYIKNVLVKHPECLLQKSISISATGQISDPDNNNEFDIEELLDEGRSVPFTSPRSIEALSQKLNMYTKDEFYARINTVQKVGENVPDKSALQGIIEAVVGQTAFAALLYAEITSNVANLGNSSNTSVTVPKPSCYDDFKKCKDVNSLNDFIAKMTDGEKSGCMLYLMYEKEDNEIYITQLVTEIKKMDPVDLKTLMGLYSKDLLDSGNVESVLNSNTPLAQSLSYIMG